jgi:hypothetical protein
VDKQINCSSIEPNYEEYLYQSKTNKIKQTKTNHQQFFHTLAQNLMEMSAKKPHSQSIQRGISTYMPIK